MTRHQPIQLTAYTLLSAIGAGKPATLEALVKQKSGLIPCDFEKNKLTTFIGKINNINTQEIPKNLNAYNSRNNQIALQALHLDGFYETVKQTIKQYGDNRVGLILGTTTSGFLEAEHAYQQRDINGKFPNTFHYLNTAHPFATAEFLQQYLQLQGPLLTITTACSSSAKIFATASRWLNAQLCDAVIACGVDSLCNNTLYGFHSLGLLSEKPCQPCDQERSGLSIGEAASFVLLERNPKAQFSLLGYGESCDAYHMSSPHPEGKGAIQAMQQALDKSRLKTHDIDYINMHGTASKTNDAAEDFAIAQLFSNTTPTSSTKGWMGHTLGAAGATEVALSLLCLENDLMPGCLNTQHIDPNFKSQILCTNKNAKINNILTNSFGFGGNNCSLIIGKNS